MTYGEAANALREAMIDLLARRYPSYDLGGPHPHRARPHDAEAYQRRCDLVQRYWAVVWRYAADHASASSRGGAKWEPGARMAGWLERGGPVIERLPDARLPSMQEMSTASENTTVELWRSAACAALAARERDLPLMAPTLTTPQRFVVLKDVADLAHALVRLDDRYAGLPGWQHTGRRSYGATTRSRPDRSRSSSRVVGLMASIRHCDAWATARLDDSGYEVDRRGYRPRPTLVPLPYKDGIDGAIDALRNAAILLDGRTLNAQVLRTVLRTNVAISQKSEQLAVDDGQAAFGEHLRTRGRRYGALLRDTVNLTGNLGGGAQAADAIAAANVLLADVRQTSDDELRRLAGTLHLLDHEVSRAVSRTIRCRLYHVAVGVSLSGHPGRGGVRMAVPRYVTATNVTDPGLLGVADPPIGPRPRAAAIDPCAPSRQELGKILSRGSIAGPSRLGRTRPRRSLSHRLEIEVSNVYG